jgi:hypothetical protein
MVLIERYATERAARYMAVSEPTKSEVGEAIDIDCKEYLESVMLFVLIKKTVSHVVRLVCGS